MKTLSPYNFGNKFLVEDCQGVKISDLLRDYRDKLKKIILESNIKVLDLRVDIATSKTAFGGMRFWFLCPICNGRVLCLYKHPLKHLLGCRNCLGLDYRKRRYKGMIEEKIIDR